MATSTYTPLANITLGSTQTTVSFTSINGSYRDLILVGNFSNPNAGSGTINMRINSDTGSNYLNAAGYGEAPTSTGAYSSTSTFVPISVSGVDTGMVMFQINLIDYSVTDRHKNSLVRWNRTNNDLSMSCTRWASTSAITSLQLFYSSTGGFASGSTFALYGVAA